MITLWGRNNSTNVKKVRWVLEELDLPYQQILAGLEFGLNHDPAYLVMNPNGLVPLLKDETTNIVLWESNTIIRYLAAQGIGVLITDHNVRETLDITDRVSIISSGSVLFEGTAEEAVHDPDVRRVYLGENYV